MINVLYITFASTNFDGATYSLMDMIASVRQYVHPIVLLRSHGCVYEYFTQHHVECIVSNFEENLVGKPVKPHQYIKYAIDYIPHRLRYSKRNRECVANVSKMLDGRHIDIVHINNTVLSFGYLLAERLRAKLVWHLRGFMDLGFGWMPLLGWKDYRKTLMRTDAVIGITPTVLEHYLSVKSSNAYVISDAVRSKKDICFVIPKEKYFLFCAALLTHQKGVDFAIKAFAKSGLAAEGYRLRILGKSHPKFGAKLCNLVESYDIADSVDFMGSTTDVKKHMSTATAFLMCSENEGLGRVSIEAMFYGCLVIGRNSGGTKDFVFDGKTGLLFNDEDSCAAAMRKAVEGDNREIIEYAQRYACANFSIEDYGGKILDVYERTLGKSIRP